jgi:hypothetical protein
MTDQLEMAALYGPAKKFRNQPKPLTYIQKDDSLQGLFFFSCKLLLLKENCEELTNSKYCRALSKQNKNIFKKERICP